MAVTLRYFTEFGKPAFQYNRFRVQERTFTFAISSTDELLVFSYRRQRLCLHNSLQFVEDGLKPVSNCS